MCKLQPTDHKLSLTYHQQKAVVMVTWLFLNFAVSRDAARRAGLSATAELLVYLGNAFVTLACLSVCLCVTRRYCIKTAKRRITQTTPRDSPRSLVFWRQNSLADDPPSPWNLRSKWPTPFQTAQFWPIFAHSASTVRASEKSSISANRKSTTRFPTSHRWTVYVTLSPPKGGTKRDFAIFSANFNFCRKKVCCKVSSGENFQRQSCSYIVPLSDGP